MTRKRKYGYLVRITIKISKLGLRKDINLMGSRAVGCKRFHESNASSILGTLT
jgi:hypothetical protein